MRLFFLLLLAPLAVTLGAQHYNYTDVVAVDSVSKNDLYERAIVWFTESFIDMEEVIETRDKEGGFIIATGMFEALHPKELRYKNADIKFTIQLWIKNNRYKCENKNLWHVWLEKPVYDGEALEDEKPDCGYLNMKKEDWEKLKVNAEYEAEQVFASVRATMTKPAE